MMCIRPLCSYRVRCIEICFSSVSIPERLLLGFEMQSSYWKLK